MNDILNFLLINKIKDYRSILNLEPSQIINNELIMKKNIKIKNASNIDDENELYDIIICYNSFSKKEINFEKLKKTLTKRGKVIFINELITSFIQYKYHPFSYVRYLFNTPIYISNVFDELRQNDLIVIDVDRIYNVNLWTYPLEYFSIICDVKI
jgi:hypothetical protein